MADFFGSLRASGALGVGDFLYSYTRAFRLGLQGDGNLVLCALDLNNPAIRQYAYYRGDQFEAILRVAPYSKALWATGTNGTNARSWIMQADGNLVVYAGYNGQGPPVWASGTQGHYYSTLVCQDDGNLVIYLYEYNSG